MYIPPAFAVDSPEAVDAFIARNPFATLVSGAGSLQVTHAPVTARREVGGLVLEAHLARANPHCRAVEAGEGMLAIFHGPHAYISPTWYRHAPAVPTWNYAGTRNWPDSWRNSVVFRKNTLDEEAANI